MNIIIRKEKEEDYHDSELVTKRAFWNKYRPGCDEHYLVHKLRTDEAYVPELTRVAEVDGTVAGLIMYAKASLKMPDKEVEVLIFGPICVAPEYQRQGIGGKLLGETLQAAKELGYRAVIIFGEPEYYPRYGFTACDKWKITTDDGKNFDAFMGCELADGGLDYPGARFIVPPVYYNLPPEAVEEYDKKFPHMEKLKLPGQWPD